MASWELAQSYPLFTDLFIPLSLSTEAFAEPVVEGED